MTFEPIDWNDEDEDAVRPRRSRRTRRRQAILDVLAEHGPLTIAATTRALHRRWTLPIVLDLDALQQQGHVLSQWLNLNGRPPQLEYRLPNPAEQDARAAEDTAFEQHLRAVLHDAADHIPLPGDPS